MSWQALPCYLASLLESESLLSFHKFAIICYMFNLCMSSSVEPLYYGNPRDQATVTLMERFIKINILFSFTTRNYLRLSWGDLNVEVTIKRGSTVCAWRHFNIIVSLYCNKAELFCREWTREFMILSCFHLPYLSGWPCVIRWCLGVARWTLRPPACSVSMCRPSYRPPPQSWRYLTTSRWRPYWGSVSSTRARLTHT